MNARILLGCCSLLPLLASCGSSPDGPTGTLIFTANGEDFVRQGWESEDNWQLDLTRVMVNVEGPTAYQIVEDPLPVPGLRHGGHPHEDIPDGTAHAALTGAYLLDLKQPIYEVGRVEEAAIGNYNRLAFIIAPASTGSEGALAGFEGTSVIIAGSASHAQQGTVTFALRFEQRLEYTSCGPNGDAGVLAEDGLAHAEMTFHFDHIFGDASEGPADPEDPETVNAVAIGFGPLAALANGGALDMDQNDLAAGLDPLVYEQLMTAVKTLGHSGEGHCHLVEEDGSD